MAFDPNKFLVNPRTQFPQFFSDVDSWIANMQIPNGVGISEDDKNVYIEAVIPGIDPKDIEVTFDDGFVWIRGEAKEEEENEKRKYYRQVSRSYSIRVAVPGDIDVKAEPEATYKNGIMTVAFAKSPKTQPRKINVKVIGSK